MIVIPPPVNLSDEYVSYVLVVFTRYGKMECEWVEMSSFAMMIKEAFEELEHSEDSQ